MNYSPSFPPLCPLPSFPLLPPRYSPAAPPPPPFPPPAISSARVFSSASAVLGFASPRCASSPCLVQIGDNPTIQQTLMEHQLHTREHAPCRLPGSCPPFLYAILLGREVPGLKSGSEGARCLQEPPRSPIYCPGAKGEDPTSDLSTTSLFQLRGLWQDSWPYRTPYMSVSTPAKCQGHFQC